jgi:hypothetical protein
MEINKKRPVSRLSRNLQTSGVTPGIFILKIQQDEKFIPPE